jgi:molecular chaperone HscA
VEAEVAVRPSYGLEDGAIERMLRDSMANARADMERRLLIEARVEAERVASAVESALRADGDLLTDGERQAIEGAVARARAAAEGSDRAAVQDAAEALEKATAEFAGRRMDRGVKRALAGRTVERLARDIGEAAGH